MRQDIKANRNIGFNIQKARIAAGLTQDKLAAKMQTEGCDLSCGIRLPKSKPESAIFPWMS